MRQPSLAERQEAAAAAKKELLERHREKMNDPGFTERQAARKPLSPRERSGLRSAGRPRRRERLGRPPRRPLTKQLNVRHRRRPSKLSLPLKNNGKLGKRQPA